MILGVATLADILETCERPVGAAMLLILSWIAASDGEVDPEELQELNSIAESGGCGTKLQVVVKLAQEGRIEDLQLACEVIRELESKPRRSMLQMAIAMALEDGFLTTAEGHIIRFLADLLAQTPSELDGLFRELTGSPFPAPADPSSAEWWEARESRFRQEAKESSGQPRGDSQPSPTSPTTQRLRDLGVLGLDETASITEVQEAYRRIVQIHHPDKFVTLGPEAVRAAEVTFMRIRSAYERLVST